MQTRLEPAEVAAGAEVWEEAEGSVGALALEPTRLPALLKYRLPSRKLTASGSRPNFCRKALARSISVLSSLIKKAINKQPIQNRARTRKY